MRQFSSVMTSYNLQGGFGFIQYVKRLKHKQQEMSFSQFFIRVLLRCVGISLK